MTAKIIPLPGAATEPVIQCRKRGRHPKCILSMMVYQRKKFFASLDATNALTLKDEIESRRQTIAVCEQVLNDQRRVLADLEKTIMVI